MATPATARTAAPIPTPIPISAAEERPDFPSDFSGSSFSAEEVELAPAAAASVSVAAVEVAASSSAVYIQFSRVRQVIIRLCLQLTRLQQ